MYSNSGCSPMGCGIWLVIFMVLALAFLVLSAVTVAAVAVGFVIYRIVMWFFSPQPRLFGAWPESRWSLAFEHVLFQLEQRTGIDTNTTPMRILAASLVVTFIPLLLIGFLLSTFHPSWLWIMPGIGLITGFATAMQLSQPMSSWFDPNTESDDLYAITAPLDDGLDEFVGFGEDF